MIIPVIRTKDLPKHYKEAMEARISNEEIVSMYIKHDTVDRLIEMEVDLSPMLMSDWLNYDKD